MSRAHRPRYSPPTQWWQARRLRFATARWLSWPPLRRARRFVQR